jgi:DNA-directed RNA polymerase alpha subunit
MTDTQLYLAIGLPCLTVMASLVISLFQISGMREDVREIRADLKSIVAKLGLMDVELGKLMDKAK